MTADPHRRCQVLGELAETGEMSSVVRQLRTVTPTAVRRSAHVATSWAMQMTRHGAVTADRLSARPRARARASATQGLSLVGGALLIGVGVALFVHARLGLPPYDVLLSVLRDRTGLSFGQAVWSMSAVLFGLAALLGQRPRLGGIAYVLMIGVAVDTALGLIVDPEPLALRIGFVFLGLLTIISGISLVVHSGLTGGSFELLMRAGQERGYDPIRVRSSMELGILVAGVVLGGDFGPATIVFAVAVGPVMRVIRQAMCDHRAGRTLRLAERALATPTLTESAPTESVLSDLSAD